MPDSIITSISATLNGDSAEQSVELQSFTESPNPPAGFYASERAYEDGRYVTRAKRKINNIDGGSDVGGEGGTDGSTLSLSSTASQEPLATHEMFQSGTYEVTADEWQKWKAWLADPNSVDGWAPDAASAGMQKFYGYYCQDRTDYLLGSTTAEVKTLESSAPSVEEVGKIQLPGVDLPSYTGKDWLLIGISAQREPGADYWTVVREYRLSAKGGWDSAIYAYA